VAGAEADARRRAGAGEGGRGALSPDGVRASVDRERLHRRHAGRHQQPELAPVDAVHRHAGVGAARDRHAGRHGRREILRMDRGGFLRLRRRGRGALAAARVRTTFRELWGAIVFQYRIRRSGQRVGERFAFGPAG
jgi:hypothetical protein